jgi:hypothetical protein
VPQDVTPAEKKWIEFFQNPAAYWDNRQTKRNPRGPDFKLKDGDVALWLDSRDTPPWVEAQLVKAGLSGGAPNEDLPF